MQKSEIEALYNSHIKLVHLLLHRYHIRRHHAYYDDCYQSACVGLIDAITTWDRDRAKLTTYAYYKIRKNIQDELSKISFIRLGSYANMLKHLPDYKVYSLDYTYNDDGCLGDKIYKTEEPVNYSDEQKDLADWALRTTKISPREKAALDILIGGKVKKWDAREGMLHRGILSHVIKKIRKRIKSRKKI